MVILRATGRALRFLPPINLTVGSSDNALGDWYANRITVGRRPLLLLVSSKSLLPILEPAKDVRQFPARFPQVVKRRLLEMGIGEQLVAAEIAAMEPVEIAKTADRAVLGILVDFAKTIPFYTGPPSELSLKSAERLLERTPCFVSRPGGGTIFPDQETHRLLEDGKT